MHLTQFNPYYLLPQAQWSSKRDETNDIVSTLDNEYEVVSIDNTDATHCHVSLYSLSGVFFTYFFDILKHESSSNCYYFSDSVYISFKSTLPERSIPSDTTAFYFRPAPQQASSPSTK